LNTRFGKGYFSLDSDPSISPKEDNSIRVSSAFAETQTGYFPNRSKSKHTAHLLQTLSFMRLKHMTLLFRNETQIMWLFARELFKLFITDIKLNQRYSAIFVRRLHAEINPGALGTVIQSPLSPPPHPDSLYFLIS
jgi:hypothetical protein